MIHLLWRVAIAVFCFVAFFYIAPLVLAVLDLSVEGDLWTLIKALAGVGALAYIIWGPSKYPWSHAP